MLGFGLIVGNRAIHQKFVPTDCQTTLLHEIRVIFRSDPCLEVLNTWLSALREQWMHRVKAYFKFARTLEHRNPAMFAESLGLIKDDIAVCQFWIRGLSRSHRVKLLLHRN
eukprot:m.117331 g.117331  ORF g.117331 m.117331 type:complete len:111 (-) comp19470_c0_seq4:272-604(-)